jgi:hypothetical protein
VKVAAVGIPWYRREDFAELRALFTDGHKLHATYEGWLAAAEEGERRIKADGTLTVRANLRPEEFAAWCNAKGIPLDSKARMEYANEWAHDWLKRSN